MSQTNGTMNLALFCDFENIALGVQDAKFARFDIEEVLERVESQLADVATTDDLRTLRESLETTLSEELAALGIDDIQGTLDSVNEDLD